jgi:AcrR family transcriptional regulator
MSWQRARQPEQKEERRQEILNAAAKLFESGDYNSVSFNAIAREAGQAKANLYRYFDSKENIFMELFYLDLVAWGEDIKVKLGTKPLPIEEIADVLTKSILNHQRLAVLMGILGTVLEKNISYEVALDFKLRVHEYTFQLLQNMSVVLPQLSIERMGRFFSMVHMMTTSLWSFAHPSDAIKKVYEHPKLQHSCISFERDFSQALITYLRGLIAEEQGVKNE